MQHTEVFLSCRFQMILLVCFLIEKNDVWAIASEQTKKMKSFFVEPWSSKEHSKNESSIDHADYFLESSPHS